VEEALEEKMVPDGVGQGDAEEIADDARRGRAPACGEDAAAPAVVRYLRSNEEKVC
jgi:hypothetical protein